VRSAAARSRGASRIAEINEILDNPPEWLQDWGREVGAKLEDGLREHPSFMGGGTRSIRRAVPLVPARANAEG
jgi:hypothetical protein